MAQENLEDGQSPAYLNGEFMPVGQARISVLDRGFIFGDAVYEVIPVYRRRPFLLSEHLTRLDQSLAAVKIDRPHSIAEWERIVRRLCTESPHDSQKIYLQVTRGVAPRNHTFPACRPTVFAMSSALPEVDRRHLELGLGAITLPDIRWSRCEIKTTSLIANVLLRQQGFEQGADEVLLLRNGLLTEGATSNVFAVKNGILLTPPDDHYLLHGVTRGLVLALAQAGNIEVRRTGIDAGQLQEADELMISSSTREVMPLTRLNRLPVGAGVPGPVWRRLYSLFQQFKEKPPAA